MKIQKCNQRILCLFLFLSCMLFCAGCDDSLQREKMKTAPASSRPKEETSTLRLPDFRKKTDAPVNTDKTGTEKSGKRSAQPTTRREDETSTEPMTEEKKKSSSPDETKKRTSSSETPRKDSSFNGEQKPTGNDEGRQFGADKAGSDNDSRRRTPPAGWTSTDIKEPPTSTNLEIWNNILVPLEKLIVARQVKFSPLGASYTSLMDLSEGKYKAVGRCTVTEKTGNQIAYEFECIASVNKYEASILSVKFHSQDN